VTAKLRFRRAQRLLLARDFQRVYRDGSRARGSLMTVAAAPNGLAHARLGLSIGKAVWKGAVPRNRVRRILREAFRLEQDALPAGVDLIVIGSTPRVVLELDAARRELVHLARKAWRRNREKAGLP
jgi:ribonuclease P protein component